MRETQSVDRPPESSQSRNSKRKTGTSPTSSTSHIKSRVDNKTTTTAAFKPRSIKNGDVPTIGSHPSVRKDFLKKGGNSLSGSKLDEEGGTMPSPRGRSLDQGPQRSKSKERKNQTNKQELGGIVELNTSNEPPSLLKSTSTEDMNVSKKENQENAEGRLSLPLGTKLDVEEFYRPIDVPPAQTIDDKVKSATAILFPPSSPRKQNTGPSSWGTPSMSSPNNDEMKALPPQSVTSLEYERRESEGGVWTSSMDDNEIDEKKGNTPSQVQRMGSFTMASMNKENVSLYLNHRGTEAFLGLALIVTLFLPDLWTIGNPSNDMDNILNGALLLFFVAFLVEMIALSCIHKEYFLSTFFWMDMVGTLSILIDFTWTSDNQIFSSNTDPGNLRAARIAKLGFRVSRMSKLSKMLKYFMFESVSKQGSDTLSAHRISSKVGMVLSQRVALLIMTVIIALPLLTPTIVDLSGSGFILGFDEVAQYDVYSANQWSASIYNFRKFYDVQRDVNDMTIFEPVWLKVRNISQVNCPVEMIVNKEKSFKISTSYEIDKNNDYYCYFNFRPGNNNGIIRKQNKRFATSRGHGRYYGHSLCSSMAPEFAYTCSRLSQIDVLFDNTSVAQEEAWFSVGVIFMVAVLLVGFTATFQMAVESLVVKPIARVMHRLKSTAEEVLHSVNTLTGGLGETSSPHHMNSGSGLMESRVKSQEEDMITETDLLEKIVDKLARVISKSVGTNRFEDMLKSNHDHTPHRSNNDGSGEDMSLSNRSSNQMDTSTKKWLRHGYDSNPTVTGFAVEEEVEVEVGQVGNSTSGDQKKPSKKEGRLPTRRSIGQSDSTVDVNLIHSFSFDVFALDEFTLCDSVLFMFERHNLMNEFSVNKEIFDEFIHKVRQGYSQHSEQDVVYHTWHHACDVMQFVYQFIHATHAVRFMSKVEIFGCLVASLAHDIGHLGVNNAFLIKTGHQLAEMHNDISPLENMHIRYLFDILRDPESNIMIGLTPKQFLEVRKQMIVCILNTDMAYHFENLKKLEVFEEINGDQIRAFNELRSESSTKLPPCLEDPKNRILLQQSFLHGADLNNPIKPFPIYSKWIKRITEEFFKQGEKELALGLEVSPNFDRETTSIPSMQLGFIEIIIKPYFSVFFKMFPRDLQVLNENLNRNHSHYKQLRAHEKEGGVAI